MRQKSGSQNNILAEAQADLQGQGINFNKPGYRRGWKLLGKVAQGMGVEVGKEDVAHWVMTLGISRAIDDLVDHEGEADIRQAVVGVASGLPIKGVIKQEAEIFSEVLSSYSEHRRQRQINGMASLTDFATARRQASSVESLIDVNLAEAEMFADLLRVPMGYTGALDMRQADRRLSFNGWVEKFSKIGYLVDSCFDLSKDYEAGNISVEPNWTARINIMRLALPEAIDTARQTPARTLSSITSTAFMMNVFERAA